jgi:hypothetical protein
MLKEWKPTNVKKLQQLQWKGQGNEEDYVKDGGTNQSPNQPTNRKVT